jgi:CHAT domain-containing protein/Tfp pilus assembly protein PilF
MERKTSSKYRKRFGLAFSMVLLAVLLLRSVDLQAQQLSTPDSSKASELYINAQSLIEEANYKQANRLLSRAAQNYRSGEYWKRTAQSYNLLSSNYRILSRLDSAAYYATEAIELLEQKELAAPEILARSYNQLGLVKTDNSNFREARNLFEKALQLAEDDSVLIKTRAAILGNFGSVYDEQGDYDKALTYYSQGVGLLNGDGGGTMKYREQLARLYNYIGITHRKMGAYDKALQFYERELDINLDLYGQGHPSVARVYTNIGGIYYYRGDYGQAILYFKRAVESTELIFGDTHPRVGLLYNNIGAVYYEEGDFDQAVDYMERSADIKRKTQGEKHPDLALTYNNIGSIYTEMEEYDTAIGYLQKSLEIRKTTLGNNHPILSNNYNSIGLLHLNTGDTGRAIQSFERSLEITLDSRGSTHPYAAEARTNLAKAYRAAGDLTEAMNYLQSAEEALELERDGKINNREFDMQIPYRHPTSAVDVLHQKGKTYYIRYEKKGDTEDLKSALQTYVRLSALLDVIQLSFQHEESKLLMSSRSHLMYEDALKAAYALYRETGDEQYAEDMFFFAEKSKARVILELLNNKEAQKFAGIPDSLVAYEHKLRDQLSSLQQNLSSETEDSQGRSTAREALQDSLFTLNQKLDTHISYLEEAYPKYHAFKYRSDVPSLSDLRSQYFSSGKGAIVEYFYGMESAWAIVLEPEGIKAVPLTQLSNLSKKVTEFKKAISGSKDSTYLKLGYELYQALIEPLEPYLDDEKVLLVPDGVLNLLPFDALLSRRVETPGSFSRLPYLLKTYQFSYTPSASLSAYLQEEQEREYADTFIAFAPVFSNFSEGRAKQVSSREGWEALPSTKYEVQQIAGYLNESRGFWSMLTGSRSAEVFTGHRATETNFKSETLSDYRFLHLATHAFTSDAESQRSGIAFFPGGSEGGEDGILYAEEIYGLDLHNELVVLSACETGSGEVRAGEGIIGLSRAFQYAGAENLLVSLWNVEDRSTARLMINFYENLRQSEGPGALRSAKQTLIETTSYAHPRYWAPFVFIGS